MRHGDGCRTIGVWRLRSSPCRRRARPHDTPSPQVKLAASQLCRCPALCHMRCWNILRNCRRTGDGVYHATAAVALMRNLVLAG
jgi:hypothetical protein